MRYLYAFRDDIVKLLRESIIMQSVLTLMVVGAWLYLVVAGRPVPEELKWAVGAMLGFFFGSKLALRQATYKDLPRRATDDEDGDYRQQRRLQGK